MAAFNDEEHDPTPAEEPNDSRWAPGAVEIQLRKGLQAEVNMAASGAMCEFSAASDTLQLGGLNEVLLKNECSKAVRVFEPAYDEIVDSLAIGLDQDVEVPDLSGFYTLYFPEGRDVRAIVEELRQLPEVLHAALVPTTKPASSPASVLPNEPLLGQSDQMQDKQWYIFRCNIEQAWALGYKGKGVVIADIDWGFLTTHPDLAPRLNLSMAHNSEDGSSNVSQGGELSHGTGVLGLAGAAANNAGMIGVAHEAELWPIQVNTTSELVVEAYSWARAIGWVTIANSGGMPKVMIIEGQTSVGGNITQIASVRAAIQFAIALGVVVCVPAGNGARFVEIDDDDKPFEPVGIIVGATTFDDQPQLFTNHGPAVVVSAPGDETTDLTCVDDLNQLYGFEFGETSGATAKVAGAVALMLSANPFLRHEKIKEILSNTGTPINSPKQIGKLLNCEDAVLRALAS